MLSNILVNQSTVTVGFGALDVQVVALRVTRGPQILDFLYQLMNEFFFFCVTTAARRESEALLAL